MSDTRARIIDALQDVLLDEGPGGATLEAVAARAGVSKGGLLYHFGTKEALHTGLLDRLKEQGKQDAAVGRAAPHDAVASYLATSSVADDATTRTLMAALLLVGTRDLGVESAIATALDEWTDVLADVVGDPVLARLIQLVGDGLYLHALCGERPRAADRRVIAHLVRTASGDQDA